MGWTKEQEEAINVEGKNVIVSAGAGSGKTAVLTARVQRKLISGVHIDQLLVLTFTNAAAHEMKERIRKTIKKTPDLKEELSRLDNSYITTFDAFSLSLVKKYNTYLNITNNVCITDQVIVDLKRKELLDKIFDNRYLLAPKSFTKLIGNFCLKDDEELKKYIDNVYKKIELKYDKGEYLDNYINNYYNDSNIFKFIDEYMNFIKDKQSIIQELLKEMNTYFDNEFIIKIEDSLSKLLTASTYDEFRNALDFKSVISPKNSDPIGLSIKQSIFDIAKEIKALCIYENIEEMKEEIYDTKDNVLAIIDIIKELDKELESYKKDNEIFTFSDIARMAIKLVLEHDEIREELKETFNEILIDEYQDTSDIQEYFISLISKNNVYMVGDIKQSIYRFRNANPYLFKSKYDEYKDSDSGVKIDLLNNFRSREEVLSDINLLFNDIMDDSLGGAEYKANHQMIFGNQSYNNEGRTDQNYNLEVYEYDSLNLKNITKDEEEAFIIGYDILDKMNNNYKIFDKDTLEIRDITYNDIVILLDRSKQFDLYKKVFEYLHIPLTILKDESLTNDMDILVIKNLFKLLICIKNNDYSETFKYAFIAVSRSFLYKTSDSLIYECFANDKFKESELYKKCLELVPLMDITNLSNFLLKVFDHFDYAYKLITVGNVKSYRVRKEYIYNLCNNYESTGKNIYDFVDYLDEILNNDLNLSFNILEDSSNSCKIMTIHKSKGLEFPICYFASFSAKFNTNELKEKIIFDNKYGIVIPKVNEYYKDTIIKILLKQQTKREEISEKIRLLYVAVTRAKEKMIIVLPKIEEEKEFLGLVPMYEREKYNSFLSIIKSIYSKLLNYKTVKELVATKDYLNVIKDNANSLYTEDVIDVKEIEITNNLVDAKHYSKESIEVPTREKKEMINNGLVLHKVLEEIDFYNYDLSGFDISDYLKHKVEAFLNSELIKNRKNSKMYKEYEFIFTDNSGVKHGIIDLLIEDDEEILIIDYKLKNIDDTYYINQLNGYRDYIKTISDKKISCYLYSLLGEEFKKIVEQ